MLFGADLDPTGEILLALLMLLISSFALLCAICVLWLAYSAVLYVFKELRRWYIAISKPSQP